MIRHVIAASAILLGTTLGAAALPVQTGMSLAGSASEAPLVEVKKGGHKHGWGHHKRGRHYGWKRGRHLGWYKHHRRHRW
jgi:Spy/CpxP family protein refolding chaperone